MYDGSTDVVKHPADGYGAPVRLGLSTVWARSRRLGPDAVVDLLLRSGADGVELDDSLDGGLLEELVRRLGARRDELAVWIVENVCPASSAARAELGSRDRGESDAAIAAGIESVRLAGELEAPLVLLRLGEVATAKPDWPDARRAFLRGELDADSAVRARLVAHRAAGARAHLDPLRRALERIARAADAGGVTLGLRNPSRFIGLPDPIELRLLLDELAGAPLAPAFDAPAAHLVDAMGLGPLADTLAAWQAAPACHLADACGPIAGLPPGSGELDLAAVVAALDPAATFIFTPSAALDESEVFAALASLRTLLADAAAARARADAAAKEAALRAAQEAARGS